MKTENIISLFQEFVIPTYSRFPVAFVRGQGSYIWDAEGKKYLDFGAGIAVCSIGHGHPEIAETLASQARTLIHTSNLYYTEEQGQLAKKIVSHAGKGKCFFCNSGAEANDSLYKLARKFGHDQNKYEVITALNSFHGRSLAGINATGQDKVKKGFEPAIEGFKHVPFNDLAAMEKAISNKTAAILIEGIQGESGIHLATKEYLLGLRKLCDEKGLLLMMDAVQCGMFRTGRFQSFQRILETKPGEPVSFLPDAVSMAKGLAGGISMGAIWVKDSYSNVLGPGTHGSTFGGTPLACSAALKVFEIIERDKLDDNARQIGSFLLNNLNKIDKKNIQEVRGLGLMIGVELHPNIPKLAVEGKTPAALLVQKLHEEGLLTVPAGTHTIRLLPAININQSEAEEALEKIQKVLKAIS
jgi:acetylornithine/N-succinyldiaminopimelate aminotransferase